MSRHVKAAYLAESLESHDYAGERLVEIVEYCRSELSRLVDACARLKSYARAVLLSKNAKSAEKKHGDARDEGEGLRI